jgi:basic membrane protein A
MPALAGILAGLLVVSNLVAGCGFFNNPGPTSNTQSGSATNPLTGGPSVRPTPTHSPTPKPRAVKSIVLVAAIGETQAGTPSAVAWQGIQAAAQQLGATPTIVNPLTRAQQSAAIGDAAKNGATFVVTFGTDSYQAVADAAESHPDTQFLMVDETVADNAPANILGLIFDEAEVGYLAGAAAAGMTASKKVGLVGDVQGEPSAESYAAGFQTGAAQLDPSVTTATAYAGRTDDPQRGRIAAAALIKGGADVIAAPGTVSGNGAMRAACDAKVRVISLETDAAKLLPDVVNCLVVSVLKRYDVAVRDEILRYASGAAVAHVTMNDAASGGIGYSDFGAMVPQGLQDQLGVVLALLAGNPPRATPTPSPAKSAAASPAGSAAASPAA